MKKLLTYVLVLIITGFASCSKNEEISKSKECDILEFSSYGDLWTVSNLGIECISPDPYINLITPTIIVSDGATVSPKSGERQDFSDGKTVTYIVTAEDGITKKVYTAKVTLRANGTAGTLSWVVSDSTLTISGTGAMPDYNTGGQGPWDGYRNHVNAVVMKNGITHIGSSAFDNSSTIRTINIPQSVETIGNRPFTFCNALTSIQVDANNTKFSSIDGVLFGKEDKVLLYYPRAKADTKYTIPEFTMSVNQGAFYSPRYLTSVTIPSSVTSFQGFAFNLCSTITEIINHSTIPQSTPVESSTTIFYEVDYSTCVLRVPAGSIPAYRAAISWKNFVNIVAIE